MIQRLTKRLCSALITCSCALLCLPTSHASAATKTAAVQTAKAKSASNGAKNTKPAAKTSAKRGKTGKKSSRSKQSQSAGAPAAAAKPIFNAAPIAGPKFTTARASIKVVVNGEDIPYQRFFTTVMPGQPLNISVEGQENYLVNLDGKPLSGQNQRWVWQAPAKPGYHQVQVIEQLTQKTLTLHVFVLAALKNGSDNIAGFTIGRYPPPKDGKAQYKAPLGFIEVNASNQHLYLSPHFQLGQFLCRQKDGLPQYIALMPDLLEKLEWLLEAVNQRGTRLDTFEVMSGFRTPFYNRLIRNVVHSRHIYGSAADIFIDVNPRDGVMDDLNRDGRYDKKDADVLYSLADAISEAHPHLAGGVGQYSGN
ncbi:MAG TPA: D-Ala-D-Ala carboxypeptidase family metallohydrolase, partial [Cellvibrionaceae bacterium]|nr:D-Ala-D-Ala carboxypeptidase family metallohydrolase [Cellvibrionaceae bacterium]